MVTLSIVKFLDVQFREASTFKNKEGQEIAIAAHYVAEAAIAESTFSKLRKANVVHQAFAVIRCDVPSASKGEFLVQVEKKNDEFRITKILGPASLASILVDAIDPKKEEAKYVAAKA